MPVRRADDSVEPVAAQAPAVPLQRSRTRSAQPGGDPPGAGDPIPATGHVVIHLRGEVDLDGALRAAESLGAALEAGPASVDVNLEAVTSIDTCLINVLAVWRQRCAAAGSLLLVTCSSEPTRGLFCLAGMDDVLSPVPAGSPA